MRVTSIELLANDKRILNFNVAGPDPSNQFILRGVTGLDADEIVPLYYAQGAETEVNFFEMVMPPREIALKIGLNPDYNRGRKVDDLRGDLLRAISANRKGTVDLVLLDGSSSSAVISGFIVKFEAPVSTKDPEATITIRCNDPVFKAPYATEQILTDLSKSAPVLIDPVSTAPHGVRIVLTFTGSVNPFIIKDPDDDWQFRINYAFLSGDQLILSSLSGDKMLARIRSGVTLHLMDKVAQGSIWPIIFPGENLFAITGTSFNWNEVYWYESHWGV